jgi:hypothetical protein
VARSFDSRGKINAAHVFFLDERINELLEGITLFTLDPIYYIFFNIEALVGINYAKSNEVKEILCR